MKHFCGDLGPHPACHPPTKVSKRVTTNHTKKIYYARFCAENSAWSYQDHMAGSDCLLRRFSMDSTQTNSAYILLLPKHMCRAIKCFQVYFFFPAPYPGGMESGIITGGQPRSNFQCKVELNGSVLGYTETLSGTWRSQCRMLKDLA